MSTQLFDDMVRDYEGPRLYAETSFTYLNRSARPEYARVRELLEEWFFAVDAASKRDLRGRFRSDDEQFYGAFFELYCRTIILRQGYLIESHQSADETKTRLPDFKVYKANEPIFFLECTVALGGDLAKHRVLDQLYDGLDHLESPNFFVGIEITRTGGRLPSARKMRAFLADRLSQLDPDQILDLERQHGYESLPRWQYKDKSWEVTFIALPKSEVERGKPGVRPLALQIYPPQWIESRAPLLHALKSKSGRYGALGFPYIIAANALTPVDQDAILEALLGKERFLLNLESHELTLARAPDGLWIGPKGLRNTRVSAVLIASELTQTGIAMQTPVLWHNPWAQNPLDPSLWRGQQMVFNPESSEFERRQGKEVWQILGIPDTWPYMP